MEQQVNAAGRRNSKLSKLALALGMAFPAVAMAQVTDAGTTRMQQVEVQAQKVTDNGAYTIGATRTATPLDMSLRETPQSVSVITQQRIIDQNLLSITDVANNVTGVSVNQYETHRGGFTARGFDIDNLQVDSIPTTWNQAWSSGEVMGSLAQYDRVEVVRGATGLMTGAGNPSAAINLVRKRASSKQLAGSAEVTVGRWDKRRVMADVSTALNESGSVRGRVVGEYIDSDSWVQYVKNNEHTFYATVEADLTSATKLTAGFSRQQISPEGSMWGGLPYRYSDGTPTNWDRSKTTGAPWTRAASAANNTFVELDHSFANGWDLRATYTRGERDGDSHLLYLSGVPDRATGIGLGSFPNSYLTHSVQNDFSLHASGTFELGGRQHDAAFGYLHAKNDFNSDNRAPSYPNIPGVAPGAGPDVGDFNNWNGAAYPEPTWAAPSFYEASELTQQGLYGMARFALSDTLKLVLGARLTNYEKEGGGLWSAPYRLKYTNEITPYAGLVFDLNDRYSLYASYTDIFQPQNLKDVSSNLLDPIVGESSEVGIKGEFFDRRVNAALAVFYIKQDKLGQPAGVFQPGDSGVIGEAYYRAADGATSKGIEIDISGELAPGLNASLGYSIYRAEDAAGNGFNTIYPRGLLRTYATYRLPGEWSKLSIGGGVNYEGRTWTVDPGVPAGVNGLILQKSYALVNLMARYEFSKQLSAQLNFNNVTDRNTFAMFAAYNQITYAAPRNASLTLRYRF